jgi:Tol biopolymer transport system component
MRRLLPPCLLLAMAVPQACHRDEVTAPRTSAAAGGADASTARIAFVSTRNGDRDIYVMNADGSAQTRLTDFPGWDFDLSWSPDGTRIAFVSERNRCDCLFAMSPDGANPTPLTSHPSDFGDADPVWSPDGQSLAVTRFLFSQIEIYRIAADGTGETRLTNHDFHDDFHRPRWSPDGSRIAFTSRVGAAVGYDLYVMNADGSAQTQLADRSFDPRWSPTGQQIAFTSTRDGNPEIYVMNADGSAQTRLTENAARDSAPRWSPDGQHIVFSSDRDGDVEIYVMNADGSAPTRLTNAPGADAQPDWSPDGRQIAFTSHRDGNAQVYVMNADGSGQTRLTNAPGENSDPSWSPAYHPSRAPANVDFTIPPPPTVKANDVMSPAIQVTVTDASWHPVPGGVVHIEIGTSATPGATLSGTTEAKLVDGVATFADLRIDQAGRGYTLRAVTGAASGSSGTFTVVGPAAQLGFVAQPPGTVEGGTPIARAVQVAIQDALGSTVPGATQAVTLALAANTTGATLSGTTTVGAVDGVATFNNLSVDRPGSYTLSATATALTGVTSTSFAVHLTFAAVSAGNSNTCGVTISAAAYCWGRGGLLGDGTSSDQASPVPVAGGLRFRMISAYVGPHVDRTCGVTVAGAAYCWGTTPAVVSGGLAFRAVTAGQGSRACGLTTRGDAVDCWNSTMNPTQLDAGGLIFAQLDGGVDYTCGVTSTGAAYCQGLNDFGQLGDGTYGGRPGFAAVVGGLTFAALSARGSTTCGVTSGGAAYCWGSVPGHLEGVTSPAPVTGGLSFASISTGFQICGVATGGAAYCWGGGNGPSPVAVGGGVSFATVGVGGGHTCGVTPSGAAYCWGDNRYGQLGNGTTTASATPVQVVQ